MQITPHDILQRSVSGGTTLWVSQRVVVGLCGISDELIRYNRTTYKQTLPPSWATQGVGAECLLGDTGKGWRWGRKNGMYYYDYDRIPDRAPRCYRSMLPTKGELIALVDEGQARGVRERESILRRTIKEGVQARVVHSDATYFTFYGAGDSRCVFGQGAALQLAQAAAWVRYVRATTESGRYVDLGLATKEAFYNECAAILSDLRLEGLRVTTSESLRKKVSGAPDGDELLPYLVSGKYGNAHRRIIGKEQIVNTETGEIHNMDIHEAIILNYWLNIGGATKGTKRELYEDYCADMEATGTEPVSLSTFTHYTGTWDKAVKYSKERHGKDYAKAKYKPYAPANPLQWANSLWCSDGSGVVPYAHLRPDGKLVMHKLYVMMITDVASKYIVGYAVSRRGDSKETPRMLRDAFRMALKNNGSEAQVQDFRSDNHGAYTSGESKAFLAMACHHFNPIEPGNSQGNPAEAIFRLFKRRFKRVFMLAETSWGATSIESMANPDYLKVANLPSYEGAIPLLKEAIEQWNHTILRDGTTPATRFEVKNPKAKPYDERVFRRLTGEYSEVDLSYMRGFVDVQRGEDKYRFEVPQTAEVTGLIARHMGYRSSVPVSVWWDAQKADIYTRQGVYILSCDAVTKVSKSMSEATPETLEALDHHWQRAEAYEEQAAQGVRSVKEAFSTLSSHYCFNIAESGTKEAYNGQMEDIQSLKYEANGAMLKTRKKTDKAAAKARADALSEWEQGQHERNLAKIAGKY